VIARWQATLDYATFRVSGGLKTDGWLCFESADGASDVPKRLRHVRIKNPPLSTSFLLEQYGLSERAVKNITENITQGERSNEPSPLNFGSPTRARTWDPRINSTILAAFT
jgi:hypothetical protein